MGNSTDSAPARHTAKSFCRNYSALCSMEVTVEDGRLVSAAGDGTVSPSGGYMCVKGLASIDFHNGAEGWLLHSLKRDRSGRHIQIVMPRFSGIPVNIGRAQRPQP